MKDLNWMIDEAIKNILCGDNVLLIKLREQLKYSQVTSVEQSEVGCYVNFKVCNEIFPVTPLNTHIGDLFLEDDRLVSPIGFILFIKEGYLSFLEIYTYGDDKLPVTFDDCKFYYSKDGNPANSDRNLPS